MTSASCPAAQSLLAMLLGIHCLASSRAINLPKVLNAKGTAASIRRHHRNDG
ncbi:hypothetical protein PF005_g30773 [Phytophthora fragariae]|uniref:RxLR effector protein n=2 Tax=Phytophthora TaxID=4783 RepID=A0A6A3HXD8_9STRA|nr:hypothetical protein PF003_g21730 [Phytophthora fragariae]KAE8967407.1 hypothetical protein PR002_g28073 [Phytophthora rubi]KAE8918607.1 hypothetical protein PF009_g31080 [Phytophthora fragariae]KAE8967691.1 hypothetical protein PR001_g28027 [Phytophthora rubi]KAE8974650.1 hypothetical protein PF011_g24785 [Phytophthora fragariae]